MPLISSLSIESLPMKVALHTACLVFLPLALAGCGQSETTEKAGAGGEILPGSASDAMLPLDTVRSQPPLAPPTAVSSARAGDDDEAGAPSTAASDEAAPERSSAASDAAAPLVIPSKAAAPPTQ